MADAQSPADSVGLEWDITNDADHDASVSVEFKVQGAAVWRTALPLLRIDFNGVNRLAGSILFLPPDTEDCSNCGLSGWG